MVYKYYITGVPKMNFQFPKVHGFKHKTWKSMVYEAGGTRLKKAKWPSIWETCDSMSYL